MADADWEDLSLHRASIDVQIRTANSCPGHSDNDIGLVDNGGFWNIKNRDIERLSLPNNGSHRLIEGSQIGERHVGKSEDAE